MTVTPHPLPGSVPCSLCWRAGRGWCVGRGVYLVGDAPACGRCARRVGRMAGAAVPAANPVDLGAVAESLDKREKNTRAGWLGKSAGNRRTG